MTLKWSEKGYIWVFIFWNLLKNYWSWWSFRVIITLNIPNMVILPIINIMDLCLKGLFVCWIIDLAAIVVGPWSSFFLTRPTNPKQIQTLLLMIWFLGIYGKVIIPLKEKDKPLRFHSSIIRTGKRVEDTKRKEGKDMFDDFILE